MHQYRVLLLGENFYIHINGKKKMMGFYTTRFVEAENPEQAEENAVDLVRKDKKLQTATKNKPFQPQPKIYLDELDEIDNGEMDSQHGYAWFEM